MTDLARQNYWAVVPAAGAGRRMGASIPKQYLPLNGRTVLEHTLARLANHPAIRGVVVALAADDIWWPTLTLSSPMTGAGVVSTTEPLAEKTTAPGVTAPIYPVRGGPERCHSVLNALEAAMTPEIGAREEDWVLVHDAARPCLRSGDIGRLIAALSHHPVGGLLGNRVRDTMKRTGPENEVTKTVDREGLWHALTPQMFRLGRLSKALTACIDHGVTVTDEAQAIELQSEGARDGAPCVVEGASDNIKITRPDDLRLAAFYLQQQ
ncbi:MAG: 2-C-methyl-D-erythritol 4-phosphate cytidylyltransferase [Candidatus Kentron sp. G]|nr:MAG: 2-C-methyl-D-erythritol 4-phosphate cytidylyltransferase [Candidatus Kentron sp. G]VFN01352.1 MAG: 2-C-methyl-D-erythritol 4-phosphate cytidylyltransferase [Candidatus Kentron sp. G]VFN01837.1 MAG: 2-C-methyl-D-erythritol 4-phosphate cytidylyltransferase [Candidatus Kentron sp. G]